MEAFHAPDALHRPPPLLAPLHGPDHPGRGPLGSACTSEGPRSSVAERPWLHSPPAALPTGCPAPPASRAWAEVLEAGELDAAAPATGTAEFGIVGWELCQCSAASSVLRAICFCVYLVRFG